MDYKKEGGRRIRVAREARGWKLRELEAKIGGALDLKRINAYENGTRALGQTEAEILAKALGRRAAYLMGLEDDLEDRLVRNWRTLNEREKMDIFRRLESMAMASRDPIPDSVVELHYQAPPRTVTKATARRSKR